MVYNKNMAKNRTKVASFIINNVEEHPSDIVSLVADEFGISRQRAHVYISREVSKGTIVKVGKTRSTKYFLVGGKKINFKTKITPDLAEDTIWTKYVKPIVSNLPEDIKEICDYGFTEIFNNAIDHSEGEVIYTEVETNNKNITFIIIDNGIGIFRKIQDALGLETEREAILHLSKGKFTTDPSNHTGEGIFFSSRAVDTFSIYSDGLYFTFQGKDWFLSSEKIDDIGKGTLIKMVVSIDSKKSLKEIFRRYTNEEIGFGKTTVAVALSADPGDPHVSRSQAKRLLLGLDKFKWIVLDFKGVKSAGQAFVDEVFRVFKNEHPDINILYTNASKDVESMIKRVNKDEELSKK